MSMACSDQPGGQGWAEKAFRRLYPHFRYRWEIYEDVLRQHLTKQTVWLDIGCGTNEHVARFGHLAGSALGIDAIDYPNRLEAPFLEADLRKIPLPTAYANLITLRMVVEHLERGALDLSEIDRLLAPGGVVVILSTNSWSPVIFLPRVLPYSVKKSLIRRLFGVTDDEVFKTYHRFNSPARMKKGFSDVRLRSLDLLEQVPFHSGILTLVFGLWYALVHFPLLRNFRSNLLATFQKVPNLPGRRTP